MQKKSITNKITPCCNLPFSVMHWWLTNIPLNSEADREFLFSQLNQNGSITKDGWIVLINSGILELDSSMNKAQFLDIINCKGLPNCNELKLIIEGFKVGNYDPVNEFGVGWTEVTEFENYDGKVLKKIVAYEGGVGDVPDVLVERVNKYFTISGISSDKDSAIDFRPVSIDQNIEISKPTISQIQENIGFNEGALGIVTNEPNPYFNGIYKKIGGIGSGGWERTLFANPVFSKGFGNMAIGGGHTSIFQEEEGTGQGNTAFGDDAGLNLGNCWATTLFGYNAGKSLSNRSVVNSWTGLIGNTGNSLFGYNVASIANGMLDCSFFGTSAGENATTCMDNAGFGIWSLRLIEEGSENAGFGHLSLGYVVGKGSAENIDSLETDIGQLTYCWGHRNVGFGDKAGALDTGGNPLNFIKKNVYVGALTRGNNFAFNENVFGYMAEGLGSNSVAIGNSQVKTTHHFGILASFCDRRVADLPTPSRFLLGARTHILDCTHRTFDLEAIGGGSNNMPVWCDGSVWRVG